MKTSRKEINILIYSRKEFFKLKNKKNTNKSGRKCKNAIKLRR